jgi:hypothetical protein
VDSIVNENEDRWTAVPTITSDKAKLAQLQEKKRGRAKFEHQDLCVNCLGGGDVLECRCVFTV